MAEEGYFYHLKVAIIGFLVYRVFNVKRGRGKCSGYTVKV